MKIGRNQPCPCGSDKKYKKCCGSALAESVGDDSPEPRVFGKSGDFPISVIEAFSRIVRPATYTFVASEEFGSWLDMPTPTRPIG